MLEPVHFCCNSVGYYLSLFWGFSTGVFDPPRFYSFSGRIKLSRSFCWNDDSYLERPALAEKLHSTRSQAGDESR